MHATANDEFVKVLLFLSRLEAPRSTIFHSDEQCGVRLRKEGPRSVG